MNYLFLPAERSQSFFKKPNEEGCELDWLEKGLGPPHTHTPPPPTLQLAH